MYLNRLRLHFDKSGAIDGTKRDAFVKMTKNYKVKYQVVEKVLITKALKNLKKFEKLPEKTKVDTKSPLASSFIGREPGAKIAWGRSEIIVHAKLEQVLTFMWYFNSRARTTSNALENTVLEEKSVHHVIAYACKKETHKGIFNLRPREGLNSFIWKRMEDESLVIVATPTTHKDRGITEERVRVKMPCIVKIEQETEDSCKLIYCHSLSLGELIPNWILDHYITQNLQLTETVQQYFQQLRPLVDLNVNDGKAMAEALLLPCSSKEKQEAKDSKHSIEHIRVHSVFYSHVGLKQYGEENPWFEELMIGVISNTLLGSSGAVTSRVLVLSNKEARTIGNGLASILMSSTSSDLAVEEWILTFDAMQELDKSVIWFRPMMNRTAIRLLANVAWGAKFRLYSGAVLSIVDMITDTLAIIRFFKQGNNHSAWANIAFIGSSLFFQVIIVYVQTKKRGLKVTTYEIAIVLLMLKPAVDAKRVANGDAQAEGAVFDPETELVYTKTGEIAMESIPSSILQTYALLGSDGISFSAVFSIIISASCIAFASSTVSMDKDISPANRLKAPSFYGYVKDDNRVLVFVVMMLMTGCHVLMKVLACSLMLRISQTWFILYTTLDMMLFFCYKIVLGEVRYMIRLEGLLSWLVSIMCRIAAKTVVDFTLIIRYRHPFEMGGGGWSANIILNQVR